jgi:5-methylcytosine-specific restriction endonuclease McrA
MCNKNHTLKNCLVCEKQIPKEKNRNWNEYAKKKYCSKSCFAIGNSKEKVEITCQNCNKLFEVYPSHTQKVGSTGDLYDKKYCSKKCQIEHNFNKRQTNCKTCNKQIIVHGYKFENNNGNCYCSKECHNISMRKNKGQNQGRRSPEDLLFKNQLLKKFSYKCQNCGTDRKLEVHHIKPIDKYPHLRHDENNGICLCHNCHYYGVHNGQPYLKHGKYIGRNKKLNITVEVTPLLKKLRDELQ